MICTKIEDKNSKIIQRSINNKLHQEAYNDSYVIDTFRAICGKRERITLDYDMIAKQYQVLSSIILFPLISNSRFTVAPLPDNANLFLPYLFELSPI